MTTAPEARAPAIEAQLGRMTAAELLALPDDDYRYELVRGELIRMPPPGFRHGQIVVRVAIRLGQFAEAHRLGVVVAESGFHLESDPDTVRGPDVAFVSAARVPPGQAPTGYPTLAPDLAVEILSPSERPGARQQKVSEYFAAGARLVWEIDPTQHTITVHHSPDESATLAAADEISGDDVLPGFTCPVADLIP